MAAGELAFRTLGLALYLVLLFGCIGWLCREVWIAVQLNRSGIVTNAEIVERGRTPPTTRHFEFRISYRFHTGLGGTYINRQTVGRRHFRELMNVGKLEISYLPNKPRISRLAGQHIDKTSIQNVLIYLAILVIAGVAIVQGM